MTGEELAGFIETILRRGSYVDRSDNSWQLITDMEIWVGNRGNLGVLTTEQIMLKIIREEV